MHFFTDFVLKCKHFALVGTDLSLGDRIDLAKINRKLLVYFCLNIEKENPDKTH